MYAQSWWEQQRKVTFRNNMPDDMPPFAVGKFIHTVDGILAYYFASGYTGERFGNSFTNPAYNSWIFNGPVTTKAGKLGTGAISFPAIARVRSELELSDGLGLGYGTPWELDEGTYLECLGVFQAMGDCQLALVAPRRKVCDWGPSATYLFDASAATGYLPFSDAAITHESYSEISVAKTDFSQRFTIEQDSAGDDVLIIPVDGLYAFSHSQSLPSTANYPNLQFVERWPPPDWPVVANQSGTVVVGMRHTAGTSSSMAIRPCLGGMSVKVQFFETLPATTFSVTRVGPLPISWVASWNSYITSGYTVG